MTAYVPLLVGAALVLLASAVLLYKKLGILSVVDGMCSSAKRRVDAGTLQDEVTAATDVATRALDMSLRAFDDRGELQSCSYWRHMVPNGRNSGLVVGASEGFYDHKLGSEARFSCASCLLSVWPTGADVRLWCHVPVRGAVVLALAPPRMLPWATQHPSSKTRRMPFPHCRNRSSLRNLFT